MELYRSDAPLPSVGASLVKILSSIKNRSFPIRLGPFPGERTPNTAILYRMLPVCNRWKNHCYSFVSKTLRASPVHQATANVTTLKRDSVNTNRAEGCHDVITYKKSSKIPSKSMGMKLYVNYSPKDNTPSNW